MSSVFHLRDALADVLEDSLSAVLLGEGVEELVAVHGPDLTKKREEKNMKEIRVVLDLFFPTPKRPQHTVCCTLVH